MVQKRSYDQPKRLGMTFKIEQAKEHSRTGEDIQSLNPDVYQEVDRGGVPHLWAVFSKTLPHNSMGEVRRSDFDRLVKSMDSGAQSDFDNIPESPGNTRNLVNPQAALSYVVSGQDNQSMTMPYCPSITGDEAASEMMEVYEMAMHRDISFADIEAETDSATTRAIATLNAYGSDFKGPKVTNAVTAKSLFRGAGQDELVGPYVSQLLYHPFDYGNIEIDQLIKEELDSSASVSVSGWLDIQNGIVNDPPNFSTNSYYIHNPRMLGSYVHNDALFEAYFNGCMILLQAGAPYDSGLTPLAREDRFAVLGDIDLFASVAYVAKLGLQAAWHHKWIINLRLRPEVMAGRLHFEDTGAHDYGLDANNHGATTIAAMKTYNNANFSQNTALLPLLFPEGSPTHPEYPAGHAVAAGACTTVMKAFFDTNQSLSDIGMSPMHSINGTDLVSYTGADANNMTVLGEINKLASNIALGRNMAGVHYRSAGDGGILLGEKVGIAFLRDLKASSNEAGNVSFSLTKLDGTTITI